MDTERSHDQEIPEGVHHELRDVHVRPIAFIGFGLALLVAVSFFAMKIFFDYVDRQPAVPDLTPMFSERPQQPPEPRLQTTPVSNRKLIVESERKLLDSYGWMDQQSGTVRIPVSLAMKLIAERGLPARPNEGRTEGQSSQVRMSGGSLK